MTTHLIFDCNGLAHKHFHAVKENFDTNFMPFIYFKFLNEASLIQGQLNSNNLYFCFDERSIRYEIYPDYKKDRKAKRAEMPKKERTKYKKFQNGMHRLRDIILPRLGFRNVFHENGYEADDIIAHLCKETLPKKDEKIIVSADSDMYQLLDERTFCWNTRNNELISEKRFIRDKGIKPRYWNVVQAMIGKNNIPKIDDVGEARAIAFVNKTLPKDSKFYQNIKGSKELIEQNIRLVTLPMQHPDLDYGFLKNVPRRDKTTTAKWQRFCEKMNIRGPLFSTRLRGNN